MTYHARGGFLRYYRRYAKTWVHAAATAGLTAFGTLTFVHRGFAVVALAVYVLPPVALYLSGTDPNFESENASAANPDAPAAEPAESPTDSRASADEGASDRAARSDPEWSAADSPTDAALFDAAFAGSSAFAVGEGGVVLADGADGDWRVALADGPGADASDLRAAAATDDGNAVWVAGDGGALGRVDAETGRHVDHSAPADRTDAWTDVAVAGTAGDETLLLANGSGEVLRGRYRDGDVAWDAPKKPGSGSSLSGATFAADGTAYLCDTADGVFESTDGGETFDRVGVEGAEGTLADVAAASRSDCAVAADDGVCHRYDGTNWTPERVADEPLRALARGDGQTVAA
ncbi:WD40/YVTN/BNR-like repeat-containing protein, partial [Halorussus sp. GCM10023401]